MDKEKNTENKVGRGWKTAAIISWVVLLFIISMMIWGNSLINIDEKNEKSCALNICGDDLYTAYYYDINTAMCSCYEGKEVTLTKYLG